MKKWTISKNDENIARDIASRCDIDILAVNVLVSRGLTDMDSFAAFFKGNALEDPFVIKDMREAADAVSQAIDEYELICIYGDYDCDGVTSTAILYDYLLNIGANVMYYIPERADGYGLNMDAIHYLKNEGVSLIVTVDNGISAIEEAKEIYDLGMKLVVTDHHQPGDTLPIAEAVVDPHRADCESSFKHLAGCGVALKLCAALDDGNYDMVCEQYLDICALGTVADVVSLTGENRYIVREGLKRFDDTDNFGLRALKAASGCKERAKASDLAFLIAPRINASGRFGSPITAVKTLLCGQDDAEVYAGMLVNLNTKRKETEAEISKEIFAFINENPDILDQRVLVVSGKGWSHGVIGIVAARIMEYYGKPVILISEEGGEARGSARSIKGFNIFKCFQYADDLLVKYGGHECAGGLTILPEDIDEFKDRVYEYASQFDEMPAITVSADKLLLPEDITLSHIKGLAALEPFGEGNPQPVFAMLGAVVTNITPLSQGKHSKLSVSYGSLNTQALVFGTSPDKLSVTRGERVDMLVNLDVNVFNGNESVSIKVIDHRPSGFNQNAYFSAKDCYEKLKRGEELPPNFIRKIIPERDELINVYKTLQRVKSINVDRLYFMFDAKAMNFCKLMICIDIFKELGLVTYRAGSRTVTLAPVSGKADLESSELLKFLREKQKG